MTKKDADDEYDGDTELMITLRDGKRMVGFLVEETDHTLILYMAKLEGAHGGSTGATDEPTDTSSWEYAWAQSTEGHDQIVVPISNTAFWSRKSKARVNPRSLRVAD